MYSLIQLLSIFIQVLSFLFIARFIAQILDQSGGNPITRLLLDITDPILAPVRRIMPSTGMLYFSPMVVLILLQVLQRVLASYAY